MTKYRMTFEVEHDQMATVMGVLAGSVSNLLVEEVAPYKKKAGTAMQTGQERNARWGRPHAVKMLAVMEKGREYKYDDPVFTEVMRECGLAATTRSSMLSLLVRAGRIKRVARGTYVRE